MVCIEIRLFGGELITACTNKNFEENTPSTECSLEPKIHKYIGIPRQNELIPG